LTIPPHSDPALLVIITQLEQQLATQTQQINTQAQQLEAKDRALSMEEMKIAVLEQKLRLQRIAQYGKGSEKLSDLQLKLLELEPAVSSQEVQAEGERAPLSAPPATEGNKRQRRRPHPGRQTLPAHLDRVEKIIACDPAPCTCGICGRQKPVIGYEESEVLEVKPAEYFVQVIKREKRACKQCEEQGVSVAPAAERIIPKSLVSGQIIIDTIIAKYCDSLPLYRQSLMLERDTGLQISRSTMDGWVMQVGGLLLPIVGAMRRELLAGNYLQADETPVGVQTHDRRGKNHSGYLWQYGRPGGSVVFDFRMGREREGPKLFLGPFNGILQTDGYTGYERIGGPQMLHAACLAHARRKHIDAVKADPKDADSAAIVQLMDKLFAIDAQAREKGMSEAERHALRNQQAPPLLDQLRAQVLELEKKVLPESLAGKAASYTLSWRTQLTLFLQHHSWS
jgi:transposase